MLKVIDLSAGYGAINILWNLNFEIGDSEIVAFLGSNGAGKTTTVRAVTGMIRPSYGSVIFNGEALARKSSRAILDAGIVQVPECRQLFTEMTVLENLEMGAFNKATRAEFQKNLKTVYGWFPKLEERANQAAGAPHYRDNTSASVAIAQVQDGEWKTVWPFDFTDTQILYPAPLQ